MLQAMCRCLVCERIMEYYFPLCFSTTHFIFLFGLSLINPEVGQCLSSLGSLVNRRNLMQKI